jgi:hypothetical protein
MPSGDSQLLPDPPPPRPNRREAAIEAALRRFDGEPEPTIPGRPAGGWWAQSRRPQFAMVMSLALIAVIGVPATWIAIQNGALNPPETPTPAARSRSVAPPIAPAAPTPRAEPRAPTAVPPQSKVEPQEELPGEVAKAVAAPPTVASDAFATANEGPAAPLAAAPPPPATPPPPPPPPPAPPAAAQKVAEGAYGEIVTTGSRIRQPNISAERDESEVVNDLPQVRKPVAPDWVFSDRAYASFLARLQSAIRTGNRDAVIKLVRIPLRVNSNGKSQIYRDVASVERDYDRIFTPAVRQAILNQRFESLFGRDQGVMIGNGQVWFDHVGSARGPVRITAINR